MTALAAGGRQVRDAEDLIDRYCGLRWSGGDDETWAFRYFDLIPDSSPDEITPSDVVTCSALHPGLKQSDLAWFWDRRPQLRNALAEFPDDLDLADSPGVITQALQQLPATLPGIDLALLSKVLHRKRPRLIPMLERSLLNQYRDQLSGRGAQTWPDLVLAMQVDLALQENQMTLQRVQDRLRRELAYAPSALRLLDIAVWMQPHSKPGRLR